LVGGKTRTRAVPYPRWRRVLAHPIRRGGSGMGVRVRSGRVAGGEGEGQPCGLNRRLRRWLAREWRWLGELAAGVAARLGLDRYRKHFFAAQHALVLVFHGLSGDTRLLHSYESLAESPGVLALAGLAAEAEGEGL